MSFILDALRRAESQRGNQPPAITPDNALENIAEKPSPMLPLRWIAVLLVGGAAIAILLMNVFGSPRPTPPAATASRLPQPQAAPLPAIAPDTPLAEVVTPPVREVRPLGREARIAAAPAAPVATAGDSRPARRGTVSISTEPLSATDAGTRALTNLPTDEAPLPSYADARMNGANRLPEFHLDIHVFAAAPERRFVFVNNRKYREGEQLDEGGTVERITPTGVVLNHRGRRFELVPD